MNTAPIFRWRRCARRLKYLGAGFMIGEIEVLVSENRTMPYFFKWLRMSISRAVVSMALTKSMIVYGCIAWKLNGISSRRPKKYKATTNSKHNLPVAENLLNQDFTVDKPNTVWVSDISYIWIDESWDYLATVKDLFNREIVGWAVSSKMTRGLVIEALNNAIRKCRPPAGLIHHSDRGVQYCSKDYQALLAKHKMRCNMSRKGNCYDNASAETFCSTIKNDIPE